VRGAEEGLSKKGCRIVLNDFRSDADARFPGGLGPYDYTREGDETKSCSERCKQAANGHNHQFSGLSSSGATTVEKGKERVGVPL